MQRCAAGEVLYCLKAAAGGDGSWEAQQSALWRMVAGADGNWIPRIAASLLRHERELYKHDALCTMIVTNNNNNNNNYSLFLNRQADF